MNTYAKIDLGAIKNNILSLKKILSPGAKFMAVVKANAYGHGAVAVARTAEENGVEYLAVANISEAIELRNEGILVPILILTESPTSALHEVIAYDLAQTIYSFSEAQALSEEASKRNKKARVHIKVDTGMGRVGVSPSSALSLVHKVSSLPNLVIEGIFTHFAKAEETGDNYTIEQFEKFKGVLAKVAEIPIKHAANSAATVFFPQTHLDMVRVGLMIYGLYPSDSARNKVNLTPALSFLSRVTYVKRVDAGTPLGYGGIYKTKKETTIVTIPVGYADGFSRRLSNKGRVLIGGKRYPVVGRISMDLTLADIGDAKVKVGDEVVLIGRQGLESISADEIAELEDTISYEIVCSIGKRVPRIYK